MSEFRKTVADELYFVTLTTSNWIDLFTRTIYKDIVIQNLQHCQKKEGLEIFSYVLMTNHLHMICRRLNHDLNELLGRFKSYTSKNLIAAIKNNPQESRKDWLLYQLNFFARQNKQMSEFHLWQSSNFPTHLYSKAVIRQKQIYIHQNPVKAGIVTEESSYLYSSACADSPLRVLEL